MNRSLLSIVGGFLLLLGTIWFLQGIGILPGSFMSGQPKWAVYGGIADILGVILIVMGSRRRSA